MSSGDGYKLTGASVRRLDRVVRKVLRAGDRSNTPAPPPAARREETCYGRLQTLVDAEAGSWTWIECYRQVDNDGTNGQWIDRSTDTGRSGTDAGDDPGRLAYETFDFAAVAGQVYLLRRLPIVRLADPEDEESSDQEETAWCIASPPRPSSMYQVWTSIDESLRVVWTPPRFTA